MTAKLELVSLKEHAFGGKLRKKGDKIQATIREARLLKALGRAVPEEQAPPPAPVLEAAPKRAYKRRDMTADADYVAPAPVAERQSLVTEVDKVRDGYRATFAGADALVAPNLSTLHITKPKKRAE